MSTEQRLQEIRARAEAATPGPWDGTPNTCEARWTWVSPIQGVAGRMAIADCAFIAHAREDVPWLLELIDQLQQHPTPASAGGAQEAAQHQRGQGSEKR